MSGHEQSRTAASPAPASHGPAQSVLLQRKCACGGTPGPDGERAECRRKRLALQRRGVGRIGPSTVPPVVHEVLRSPGQPLASATRAFMESRFAHDFSQVRVHPPDTRPVLSLGAESPTMQQGSEYEVTQHAAGRNEDTQPHLASEGRRSARIGTIGSEDSEEEKRDEAIAQALVADVGNEATQPVSTMPIRAAQAPAEDIPRPFEIFHVPRMEAYAERELERPGPNCKLSVTYANPKTRSCPGGRCGTVLIYDITKVTARGKDCPQSLEGLRLTETVASDNGCRLVGGVETGRGCGIHADGSVYRVAPDGSRKPCHDTYRLCALSGAFPAEGCTETYTQQLFVGGALAETRKITFRITRSGDQCSGTATRR